MLILIRPLISRHGHSNSQPESTTFARWSSRSSPSPRPDWPPQHNVRTSNPSVCHCQCCSDLCSAPIHGASTTAISPRLSRPSVHHVPLPELVFDIFDFLSSNPPTALFPSLLFRPPSHLRTSPLEQPSLSPGVSLFEQWWMRTRQIAL